MSCEPCDHGVTLMFSRAELLRALAVVRRNWRAIRRRAFFAREIGRQLRWLAGGVRLHAHPADGCVVWPIDDCREIAGLVKNANAVLHDRAPKTMEVLWDAADALSCGYWNQAAACDLGCRDEECETEGCEVHG